MNIEATSNNAAQVAQSATVANTKAAQTAENAQSVDGAAVLSGSGVTVSTAAPTTEEVVEVRNADKAQAALVQETVTGALELAEEVDTLASELQVAAFAAGETATTASVQPASTQSVVTVCEAAAAGNAAVVEAEVSSWVGSGESVDANFSIYQLANLLQEVGQEQRNAARELRSAELETELASLSSQATRQRRGAVLSAAVSTLTCVAQVSMIAVSYAASTSKGEGSKSKTGNGMNNQQATTQSMTYSAAQKTAFEVQMNTTQATVNASSTNSTVEAAGKNPSAQHTEMVASSVSPENQAAVESRYPSASGAKDNYQQIKGKMSEVSGFKATNEARAVEISEEMSAADKAGDQAKVDSLKGELKTCMSNIEAADKTLASLKPQAESAAQARAAELDGALEQMNSEYKAAAQDTLDAEGVRDAGQKDKSTPAKTKSANQKNVDSCREKQKNLGEQRALMEAKVVQEKAEMGIAPTEEELEASNQWVKDSDAKLATTHGDGEWKIDAKKQAVIQQVSQIVGQIGQSCSHMIDSLSQASMTVEKENEKQAEADRQETSDLFSQAQQLIDAARDLLKSVIQSESQSIEKIISA